VGWRDCSSTFSLRWNFSFFLNFMNALFINPFLLYQEDGRFPRRLGDIRFPSFFPPWRSINGIAGILFFCYLGNTSRRRGFGSPPYRRGDFDYWTAPLLYFPRRTSPLQVVRKSRLPIFRNAMFTVFSFCVVYCNGSLSKIKSPFPFFPRFYGRAAGLFAPWEDDTIFFLFQW